jgi:propionyl-CoA carboxylase alpha chain
VDERKRGISGQMRPSDAVRFERQRVVVLGEARHEIVVDDSVHGTRIVFGDGAALCVRSAWKPGEPVWIGEVDGDRMAVQIRPILNGIWLAHGGASAEARVYTAREAELAALMPAKVAGGAGKQLLCPMPGLVRAIMVTAGQEVKVGEPLCIVEAMKMENVLRAERDATIAAVKAREGDSLAVDAVILEFA